jgi:Response regulator containing CheY-like receiver domain and AraC-type DNA-binding domain
MIKIFIIEDEPPFLRAIKQMIEQTNKNYKVIGEALNGEDAFPVIRSLKPDVVFTDINMPVLDGLTLIDMLEDMDPKPITVIISGYKEFEYAKKAIKLGVYDYLLKPVDLEIFENLLNNIYQRFQFEKKTKQLGLLEKAINGTGTVIGKNSLSASNLFEINQYICILICIGSYSSSHSSLITPGIEYWMKNEPDNFLKAQINQEFNHWILGGEHGNEKIIIIGSPLIKDTEKLFEASKNLYSCFDFSEIPVTIVISKVYQELDLIGLQVRKLYNILYRSVILGRSQLIMEDSYSYIEKKDEKNLYNTSQEDFILKMIQSNQSDIFKQNLYNMLILCEDTSCKQYLLERLLIQIFGLFKHTAESLPEKIDMDIELEINEVIIGSTNLKSLYDGLCSIVDELFKSMNSMNKDIDDDKTLMEAITKYIISNFSKPINLQTLSERFGFVPQYLGRKYKKFKGISPNDFIIKLRIEKAKELLLIEPPVVLKDISEAVGFSDQFYLSKVFKALTGKSPSEFRMEKKNN